MKYYIIPKEFLLMKGCGEELWRICKNDQCLCTETELEAWQIPTDGYMPMTLQEAKNF